MLPSSNAAAFDAYCNANNQALPVLARSEPGSWLLNNLGQDLDLRTDLGCYRVFENGQDRQEKNLLKLWRDDLVTFAMGCSFSFEEALQIEGVELHYRKRGEREALYKTNQFTRSTGSFAGPLLASMRPLRPADAIRAIQVTAKYPGLHGAPIHIGKPDMIGVELARPYQTLGKISVAEDELPVFWACGVTPQLALEKAALPFAITHVSAHMLITDLRLEDLATDSPS